MEDILAETENDMDISQILLVGGFSECLLIQDAVEAFPEKREIVPEDDRRTVLKGAVLFGHRPDYVE